MVDLDTPISLPYIHILEFMTLDANEKQFRKWQHFAE